MVFRPRKKRSRDSVRLSTRFSPRPNPAVKNRKSKVRGKLLDGRGREIPRAEYDFAISDEDFTFTLKRPGRDKSGKYTVVLYNDAGEGSQDVNANFVGE